ncbi:hypothetical protein RN001_011139 [Aquatica leii]|uniref:Proteasome assembly chaperone 1 n=1 Tax=Aquatica leii TaxID=1421715 RepID=A0AAN7P8S2_9COLE|nr:hypothetical protein RN001_011139 [Aquatica leii]
MLFGEIIEPNTRALCEDDAEYPENYECNLSWNITEVPDGINNLYISESLRITTLFQKCVIGSTKSYAELTPGNVQIYRVSNDDDYAIICKSTDIIPGLIVEKLEQWLELAKNVVVITSGLITLLQNSHETSPCIIRSLCYKTNSVHPKLEVPNMITGLSASVFSYCVHNDRPCTLYIGFFDEVPLDSLNTHSLLNLFEQLNLRISKRYTFEPTNQFNNLYV